jgi:hypothetical protein
MRTAEKAHLESLPPGRERESWEKAYAAVRFTPPPDEPKVDSKVWTPPPGADTPNTMPDPRTYPYRPSEEPFAHPYPMHVPRTLSYNQYCELFSQPLVVDPVTELSNPYRIRLQLGDFTPPYDPHPGNPSGGGFCYAWRTAATWVEHLRAGDRITAGTYISRDPWTPGFYMPRGDIGAIYWMSRYA